MCSVEEGVRRLRKERVVEAFIIMVQEPTTRLVPQASPEDTPFS